MASKIKKDFDLDIYREFNSDLLNFNDTQLIEHYKTYGKSEGRICSEIKNRCDFFKMIDEDSSILEVGKLCFPIFENSKNIDVFTQEKLIENYSHDVNVSKEKMCKVDYLIKDNQWIVDDKFDYVVSSHNIEHSPCLISFLNNIDKCLKNEGLIFLAIPDYRYCFDANKSVSNLIDILDAYYTKRIRPGFKSVLEHRLLSTHNNAFEHWNSYEKKNINEYNLNSIRKIIQEVNFDTYNDTHCWMFTPESFEEIVNSLSELKLINLSIREIYPTLRNSLEFFCVLERKII
jgi:SAM-dependent methyltransferase